jgi:hypothetical protein
MAIFIDTYNMTDFKAWSPEYHRWPDRLLIKTEELYGIRAVKKRPRPDSPNPFAFLCFLISNLRPEYRLQATELALVHETSLSSTLVR